MPTNSFGADRSKDFRKLIGNGFCHAKLHLAGITRQEVYGIQISRVASSPAEWTPTSNPASGTYSSMLTANRMS
jgi:hypothetical protein